MSDYGDEEENAADKKEKEAAESKVEFTH